LRILVLDGNQNAAVTCVRSLTCAGHSVRVGSSCPVAKAGWSRACRGTFRYPGRQENADAFVDCIAAEVSCEPGTLVLPMSDKTLLPLSSHRDVIFEAGGRLVMPPHTTVLRAADKLQMTQLAESLGIAVPRSMLLTDTMQAAKQASSLNYPVVLKPRASEEVSVAGRLVKMGAPIYATNAHEFMSALGCLRQGGATVLVQEFVRGIGAGYFALLRRGELRAEFAHRRLRDVLPTGSGSAVRVSVKLDPRVREAGLAILQALGWHGVAMVEFRIRPDGTPVFLEVNGRFWNSLSLATHAGVDFPALLAHMVEHGDVHGPVSYRVNVRCRWLLGDFRHLIQVWRGAPAGYPDRFPRRLEALARFLTPVPGTYHDNFSLRDPLPEVADWIDFVLRQLPDAMRNSDRTAKSSFQAELHAQRRYPRP
jgi:predicted ATP-grasp superfamily ATP-dependent carboligase